MRTIRILNTTMLQDSIMISLSVSMYKIIYDRTRLYDMLRACYNRKIMHALSVIVNDCIYGNEY